MKTRNSNMAKASKLKENKKYRVRIPDPGEHAAAGRQYYTSYEKDLISLAVREHRTARELAEQFATDQLCTPRSITALGYQMSMERDRQGIKKNYGHYGSRRLRGREEFYTKAEEIDMERRNLDGPEVPSLDLTPVKPALNAAEVNKAVLAVNNDICGARDIVASVSAGGLNYKDMQMNVGLLKLFMKRSRAVPGDGARMLFVSDLAEFWMISEDDANLRIESLMRHHFPIAKKGREIYLIEPRHIFGGNLVNICLDNVPSREIAGGATCTPIGIISDTHYGAKGCAEGMINEFYRIAHDAYGVRCFLHAGDFFDGNGVFPSQNFEQRFIGFDEQLAEVAWKYPFYTDVKTYAICGNHDESYLKSAGANILFALHNRRKDIVPVGLYQAMLSINGFNINLHHVAGSGNSNFPESKLNNVRKNKDNVIDFFDIEHIDLVVVGHLHRLGGLSDPTNRNVKTIIFGGSFQHANPFSTRHMNVTSVLGGYVANLYMFPDGSKHIDTIPISFSIKNRDDVELPQMVRMDHMADGKDSDTACF